MLDIVFRPPPYPITAEVAADLATNFGLNPLEMCYEDPNYCHWTLWYSPGPTESKSVVCKKPLQRSVIGLEDAIRGFLQERGLSFTERESLWAWAVAHRWPWPGSLRPEGAATDFGQPAPDGDGDWRDLVARGGHRVEHCFLVNRLIVAWSPDEGAFAFPKVLDHPTAEIARQSIAAASVRLTGHPCLGKSDAIFLPLRRHARAAGWPSYAALDARIAAFQHWCDEQIIGQ